MSMDRHSDRLRGNDVETIIAEAHTRRAIAYKNAVVFAVCRLAGLLGRARSGRSETTGGSTAFGSA